MKEAGSQKDLGMIKVLQFLAYSHSLGKNKLLETILNNSSYVVKTIK
jgi:hypothetical protein